MSDATIKAKTGCPWERWVHALDHHGAAEMSHREIATLVHEKYKVDEWWSQIVAVGYERIKGLRARGQQRDGTYEATKSRTFNVPVAALFTRGPTQRSPPLAGRTRRKGAHRPRRNRCDSASPTAASWRSGSREGRGEEHRRAGHAKLRSKDEAERVKKIWAERLDSLAGVLR